MHNRYRRPSFGPPIPPQLPDLLHAAMPAMEDFADEERASVEARRIEAIDALLSFARGEAAEARAKLVESRRKVESARGRDLRDTILALAREKYLLTDLAAPGRARPQRYVWEFLMEAGLRILTATDPVSELHQFLGVPRRGRPLANNSWRDFIITIDVQERVDSGLGVGGACAAIGAETNLSPDAIEKIYYAYRANTGVQDKRLRTQILEWVQRFEQK